MRQIVTIIIAMFAVACSQSDQNQAEATASDVTADLAAAAGTAGAEIQEGYEEARPGLEALGERAEAGLAKAGEAARQEIHEATAPSQDDQQEQPAESR